MLCAVCMCMCVWERVCVCESLHTSVLKPAAWNDDCSAEAMAGTRWAQIILEAAVEHRCWSWLLTCPGRRQPLKRPTPERRWPIGGRERTRWARTCWRYAILLYAFGCCPCYVTPIRFSSLLRRFSLWIDDAPSSVLYFLRGCGILERKLHFFFFRGQKNTKHLPVGLYLWVFQFHDQTSVWEARKSLSL